MNNRETMKRLLEDAVDTVNKRGDTYGTPIDDFKRIAAMWGQLRNGPFEPHEVAMYMICLKLSRLTHSPEHYDNWLDIAGYAACGWACVTEKYEVPERPTLEEMRETLSTFVGEDTHIQTINMPGIISKKDML